MIPLKRYQSLAVASEEPSDPSASRSGGRRLTPDWTYLIGEEPQDLQVVTSNGGVVSILLLSLHSITAFKETGVVKFLKKFEFNPSSMCAYYIGKL